MKTLHLIALLSFATVLGVFALPTAAQQPEIVVNDADSILNMSSTISESLVDSTADVQPRFTLQWASTLRVIDVTSIAQPLQSLAQQVAERIILLRVGANREQPLTYPLALIADTVPPQASGIAGSMLGRNSVKIVWSTNELADSTVIWGVASGVYTGTVSSSLWVMNHELIINDWPAGSECYFKVRSIDRSGNLFESTEQVLEPKRYVFLPVIVKKQ